MPDTDFEPLGRYTAYMEQFAALAEQRKATLKALARWAANTQAGTRCVMVLGLDVLDDQMRQLRQQQNQLTQLGHAINALAGELDRPGVHFTAHQVL
ncbi:hypothetical protein [Rhodanobacter sp. BL-MT-08]